MTDIEIPYEKERSPRYRFFEILPGALSWSMLCLPLILSFINVTLAAIFAFAYILMFLTRAYGMSFRALQGYRTMRLHQKLDWRVLLEEIQQGKISATHTKRPSWHHDNMARLQTQPPTIKPDDIIHAVIIATVNESREVLEPTIQSVMDADYDMKKVVLVIAYEGRAGQAAEDRVKQLLSEYKHHFKYVMAVKHPADIPGEVIGKGGNVTFAGRKLLEYVQKQDIDPLRVVVTTLDADNRPDKKYLAALSYIYSIYPDPVRVSFQPISVYNNNIWDAPAPMRVVATGNSFHHIAHSHRPHMLRNFSSHAQGLQSLIETDFWSVRTIVEDGHQYWRSYFRFDGKYRVVPLYVPIYQDAVLTDKYLKTLKAQFIQYRRWTWGASDIAYVATMGFFRKNNVPMLDFVPKFWRLVEGHVTWAVGPLLMLYAGFVPSLFNPQSIAANELPLIVSRIQTVALVGIFATIFICFKTLPPKPARYKRKRTIFMVMQWAYLPLTGIVYNSLAALYSQTRLMFGWYLGTFDVTEKAVVNKDGKTSS